MSSQPAHGALTLNADGSFTYTPATGFSGTDTFTYRADDGDDLSAPATVTISVNGPPTAQNDTYAATEDVALVVMASTGVLANDADAEGDPMTAALVDGPANGTLTLNPNGSFTYTPAADFSGTDTFTYRASDGNASSSLATVTINVAGANDAPVAMPDAYEVDEDATLAVDPSEGLLANDYDMENSSLSAVLISGPTHGTLALNADGSFTYTPSSNYFGSDSFTYRALDGQLSSAATTVSITVRPIADPPVISPIAGRTIFSGGTIVVDVNATDIDGTNATMAYVLVTGPEGATIDPATGIVNWTAPSDFTGRQAFSVRATKSTSDALSSTIDFAVDVSPLGGLIADAISTPRRVLALPPATRPLRGMTPERPRNGGGLPTGGNGTLTIPQTSLSRLQSGGRAISRGGSQGSPSNQSIESKGVTPAGGTEENKPSGGAAPAEGSGDTSARKPSDNDTGAARDAAPAADETLAALDVSTGDRVVQRFVHEMARHAPRESRSSEDFVATRRGRMAARLSADELASLARVVAERAAVAQEVRGTGGGKSQASPIAESVAPVTTADGAAAAEAPQPSELRKAFAAAAAMSSASAFAPMLVTMVRSRKRSPRAK